MSVTSTAAIVANTSSVNSEAWTHALLLACKLTVDLPLQRFTVAEMSRLRPGTVVSAHWRVGADVPLCVNGALLAYGEFETAGERLAIRLTELV